MILNQQLELELGDQYEEAHHRSLKNIKTVLRKPWIAPHRFRIMDNEGGGGALLRRSLCFIIEAGDITKGLNNFNKYLDREYQSSSNRTNVHHSKWVYIEDDPTVAECDLGDPEADLFGSVRSADRSEPNNTQSAHSFNKLYNLLQTEAERDFFQALGNLNGSIVEAAKACHLDLDHARRIYFRIKNRVKRLGGGV